MRFLNRYVFMFTAVIGVWTALFYTTLIILLGIRAYPWVAVVSVAYGLGMLCAGWFIGRRDHFSGYFGFNYHFMTYLVCNAAAWISQEFFHHASGALSMTLTWGIGLLAHFLIWMVLRKRTVRGFDRDELFE